MEGEIIPSDRSEQEDGMSVTTLDDINLSTSVCDAGEFATAVFEFTSLKNALIVWE